MSLATIHLRSPLGFFCRFHALNLPPATVTFRTMTPFSSLDKGVNAALGKAGHGQSASTTEKSRRPLLRLPPCSRRCISLTYFSRSLVSDGIRTGFKKLTGKDVPIKDKTYGQQ